jgi:outer membrane murein-binding lipoprotein Lpp
MDFDIKKKINPAAARTPVATRAAVNEPKAAEPTEKTGKFDYSEYKSSVYNDADQRQLLIGYDEVPTSAYDLLQPRDHVRYMTQDGKFCRGGFVHNVKTTGEPMIFLENNMHSNSAGYAKWPVVIKNIKTMWKKRTVADVKINNLTANTGLEARVEQLEMDLEKATADIRTLIMAISKLNQKIINVATPSMARLQPLGKP